jgi:hypothetical protein
VRECEPPTDFRLDRAAGTIVCDRKLPCWEVRRRVEARAVVAGDSLGLDPGRRSLDDVGEDPIGNPEANRTPSGVRVRAIPRWIAVGRSTADAGLTFSFTTGSYVSGDISWIGFRPISSGWASPVTWTIGTQSSSAFFRLCIAFGSLGPGTVNVAATSPEAS